MFAVSSSANSAGGQSPFAVAVLGLGEVVQQAREERHDQRREELLVLAAGDDVERVRLPGEQLARG